MDLRSLASEIEPLSALLYFGFELPLMHVRPLTLRGKLQHLEITASAFVIF
jgi:hypothetical protein